MLDSPFMKRKQTGSATLVAICTTLFVAIIAFTCLFVVDTPMGWWKDHPFTADLQWLVKSLYAHIRQVAHGSGFSLRSIMAAPIEGPRMWAETFGLAESLRDRLMLLGAGSLAAGLGAYFYWLRVSEPADGLTHIAGRRLVAGEDAIRGANRADRASVRASGAGLWIAPFVRWARDRETAHLLLLGTTGAGKTVILRFLIQQILRRRDKLVVHDSKGDMTSSFPSDEFVLLAPNDQRSLAWDIGHDCSTMQDARELAARMIAESKDPMWAQAARAILAGIIIALQKSRGPEWTWRDLYNAVFQPASQIKALLEAHTADASRYIELDPESNGPTRTSFGFLVNLWACVAATVGPLAEAWGDAPPNRRFSLRRWMLKDNSKVRTLILQRAAAFPELSSAWIGSAAQILAATGSSAAMSESRDRRIWLALDEFDQLGKLPSFAQLLAVGRSKGICCILGLQDLDQISSTYGEPAARAWLNMLGTKIIGRMPSGPSANFVSEQLIGRRKVGWSVTQITHGSHGNAGSNRTSVRQQNHDEIPVLYASTLEADLGRKGNRILALMLGLGDVFQLAWPLIVWPARRAATVAAEWTKR